MNTALSATTFLTAAFLCVQVQWAQADFVAPLPPKPPAAKAPDQSSSKGKSGAKVGKAVVMCVASAAASTIFASLRQGNDQNDPRDLTGREAVIAAGRGCPPFFVLLVFYPPDNAATYQVARMSRGIRMTPQGQDNFALCGRYGSGCASDNDRFAAAQTYAYQTGKVPAWFTQEWRVKVGANVAKKKKKTKKA